MKVLSGWVVPDHALDALSASYLDSNLDAKTSSWTRISGDLDRDHSSYIGVDKKPNWEEQIDLNSSFSQADMPRR